MSDPSCDTCSFEVNLASQEPCMKCCHAYTSKWKPVKKVTKIRTATVVFNDRTDSFSLMYGDNLEPLADLPYMHIIKHVRHTTEVEE